MTDGILLAEIRQGWFLNQYDTLIIDEAHERSLNIDFLLGYLKGLLPRRPDLKLIVTSATIDPQRFAEHFAGAAGPAPIIEISGRTYLVRGTLPAAGGRTCKRAGRCHAARHRARAPRSRRACSRPTAPAT